MGSTVTLIILSLPIHEHGMSYHLLRSSLISFSNALWVLVFKSFKSSVKFIEIVFLRTFSDYSQWGMEMQPFFKLFIFYSETLVNLLILIVCVCSLKEFLHIKHVIMKRINFTSFFGQLNASSLFLA